MTSVSFIIPVYNKSLYLKNVISSLKNQSGNFKREFIFIDDGSTDNSLDILKKETQELPSVKIIKQKNSGSAHATNQGIKISKMKYIKFLDADDIILSDSTNSLMNILEKNKSFVLSYGLQRKVTDLKLVNIFEKFNQNNYSRINNGIYLAMRNSMFNPSQCLVRTKLCKKVGGCDERIKFSQEYSLTLKLSILGPFARLNFPTAILPCEAPGQISENKYKQIFRVSKALELFISDNPSLDIKHRLFAQRRLTARAWRFARRHKKAGFNSKWFGLYLRGLFRFKKDLIKNCEEANKIYEEFIC